MSTLTPAQVAERLGISRAAVFGAIQRGALEAIRLTPFRWGIEPEALERYAQHRNRPMYGPDQCAKCGGPRTWEDYSYCLACSRDYRAKRLQEPANLEAKRESDRESWRRRNGKPARAPRRYA